MPARRAGAKSRTVRKRRLLEQPALTAPIQAVEPLRVNDSYATVHMKSPANGQIWLGQIIIHERTAGAGKHNKRFQPNSVRPIEDVTTATKTAASQSLTEARTPWTASARNDYPRQPGRWMW
jgi:hypothetical protein